MSLEFDALSAKVDKIVEDVATAVVVMDEVKAALDAAIANGDTSKLQALSDKLGAAATALEDATTRDDVTP